MFFLKKVNYYVLSPLSEPERPSPLGSGVSGDALSDEGAEGVPGGPRQFGPLPEVNAPLNFSSSPRCSSAISSHRRQLLLRPCHQPEAHLEGEKGHQNGYPHLVAERQDDGKVGVGAPRALGQEDQLGPLEAGRLVENLPAAQEAVGISALPTRFFSFCTWFRLIILPIPLMPK